MAYLAQMDIRQPHSLCSPTHLYLDVSFFTIWWVLKVEILQPYNVQTTQVPTIVGYLYCVAFARWVLQQSTARPYFTGKYTFHR